MFWRSSLANGVLWSDPLSWFPSYQPSLAHARFARRYTTLSSYHPASPTVSLLDRKSVGLELTLSRWTAWCAATNPAWLPRLSTLEQSATATLPPFHGALGLHTCGPLTDIILEACARNVRECGNETWYVVCPCCYAQICGRGSARNGSARNGGGDKDNVTNNSDVEIVEHPRSERVRSTKRENGKWDIGLLGLGSEMSVVNSKTDAKDAGGGEDKWEYSPDHPAYMLSKQCMNCIDVDRSLRMGEHEFEVGVSEILPITSTPKNQVLWGRTVGAGTL